MLGKSDSSLQNYINKGYSVDIKPRVFLEFNGNDSGEPYFYGTGDTPSGSYSTLNVNLNAQGTAPAVINGSTARGGQTLNDYGVVTGVSGTAKTELIKVGHNTGLNSSDTYYANGPVGVKDIKFNMFLKSDYMYQVNDLGPEPENQMPLESFNVVLTAFGIDSSSKVVRSEVVTKSVTVDSQSWLPVTVSFANPDDKENEINRVRLTISVDAPSGYQVALLVSQLICTESSEYEVYVQNRLPVSEVFESNRPGEFMVDLDQVDRPTVLIAGLEVPQLCSPMQMSMSYAIGPKYEAIQRSVMPFQGNPYSYYVSGSDTDSKKIWCFYKNVVKTNKIVIKVNAIATKPDTFSVQILTTDGNWGTLSIPSAEFDNNGILVLYYTGTGWSTTKWRTDLYPKINTSSSTTYPEITITNSGGNTNRGYVNIVGIAFQTTTLETINSDFSDIKDYARLELIELSPRLELDVTNLTESVNIIKELDNDSGVLPIGSVTANSANIELSNIIISKIAPDTYVPTDVVDDVVPFSNFSALSPLKDLLKKGVKVRGGWDIDESTLGTPVINGKTYIPSFSMRVDSWKDNDSSITINAFDVVKDLQTTKTRPVYLEGARLPEIIRSVLDPIGFADYKFDDLRLIRVMSEKVENQVGFSINEKVPYFWTNKDNSVTETLQDLFKTYQIAMYADEYGCVRFTSLYQFNAIYLNLISDTPTKTVDLYVQDSNDSNSNSNIQSVDFIENDKPQSVVIKYRIPRPHLKDPNVNTDKNTNQGLTTRLNRHGDIVWTLQEDLSALPYFEISGKGILGIAQNYIPYSPRQATSIFRYIPDTGMLLIDDEIVSYDGKEFLFTYKTPTDTVGARPHTKKIIINKPEDVDMMVRDLMANESASYVQFGETGRLMNVKRGLYGTIPSTHTKSSVGSNSMWRVREFTKSEKGYKNASNVSASTKKWSITEHGIQLNSSNADKILFMSPREDENDNYKLRNKRRLSATFRIGDIPKSKEGYLGVGVGVSVVGGNIDAGLIVWFGVEANKDKKTPTVFIEQIVNGQRKTLVAKDEFEYSDRLFEENENLEVIFGLNDKRDECRILIGGTSAYAQKVKSKPANNSQTTPDTSSNGGKEEATKEYKDFPLKLKAPLGRASSFGVLASYYGSGIVGQFLFGISRDPRNMNDLSINNMRNDYGASGGIKARSTFAIGENTLLDKIVNNQLVPGFNDISSDNFVYTASPIARGIKIFEVEYDNYPVISNPNAEFLGYNYDINAWQSAPLFTDRLTVPEGNS